MQMTTAMLVATVAAVIPSANAVGGDDEEGEAKG
jgi:hypothetical protein